MQMATEKLSRTWLGDCVCVCVCVYAHVVCVYARVVCVYACEHASACTHIYAYLCMPVPLLLIRKFQESGEIISLFYLLALGNCSYKHPYRPYC